MVDLRKAQQGLRTFRVGGCSIANTVCCVDVDAGESAVQSISMVSDPAMMLL